MTGVPPVTVAPLVKHFVFLRFSKAHTVIESIMMICIPSFALP